MLVNKNIWEYTSKTRNFSISNISYLGRKINTGDNESAYGHVYELYVKGKYTEKHVNGNLMYVLKLMEFQEPSEKQIFMNEVKIGAKIKNKNVGPRIYAYAILGKYGFYVMDHFKMGDSSLSMMSMNKYLMNHYPTKCPEDGSLLITKLKSTLEKFYRITNGYHGDLHTGNLYVLYRNNHENIIKVLIFDYGAHIRFRKSIKKNKQCKTLNDIFKRINSNFNTRKRKAQNVIESFPKKSKDGKAIPLVYNKNKQPFRSNINMMHFLNARNPSRIYNKNNGYPMLR